MASVSWIVDEWFEWSSVRLSPTLSIKSRFGRSRIVGRVRQKVGLDTEHEAVEDSDRTNLEMEAQEKRASGGQLKI